MEQGMHSAIFGIISVVNLLGNVLVVVLFVKRRDWLKKAHSCILLALAIQDILIAISLLVLPGFVLSSDVYKLPSSPKGRQLYCSLIWSGHFPFALSVVSTYSCLMLALDRCSAVLKPLTYQNFCTSGKVIAAMVILPWFAGFGLEIGTALITKSSRKDNGSYVCKWVAAEKSAKNMTIAVFLLFGKGLLPAVTMTIAYAKMMNSLRKSSLRVLPTGKETHSITKSSRQGRNQTKSYLALQRITRMTCAASAIVVICWLPDQIYYCLFELDFIQLDASTHNGLHILAFINTCLNPFLYSFSNKQYKEEFKLILCCIFDRNTRSQFEDTATGIECNLEERNQTC